MEVLETARDLAERLGDLDSLCRALHNLGWVHDIRGEYDRATVCDERALEITQRVGDPADVAYALYRCGLTAFFGGDWARSRECFEQAGSIIGAVGLSSAVAYVLHGVGQMRLAEGRWEAATAALEEAISLAGRSANLQNARAAQNALAERDLLEGRPEVARERLEPLLDSPGRQETDVTFLLPRLAWAYLDLGEERHAQELLAQSVARATAGGNRLALLDTLRVQAQAATRQKDWAAAIGALEQGVALSRAMPCPYGEVKALYIYGLMHAAKGEPSQARERLEAAQALCSRL
jgi:tetratricopeptide (TPR) repeat protein